MTFTPVRETKFNPDQPGVPQAGENLSRLEAMSTSPPLDPVHGQQTAPRSPRPVTVVLLASSFVLALFPAFHWGLGTAGTAMFYLLGTATFITATIVACYFLDRRRAPKRAGPVAAPSGPETVESR